MTVDTGFLLNPPATPADLKALESDSDRNWVLYHLPYSEKSQAQPLAHWNLFFTRSGPLNLRTHDMWCRLHDPAARITTILLPTLADSYLRQKDNFIAGADFSYAACVARAERSINGDVRQDDLDKAVTLFWSATQSISLEIVRQLPKEGIKWVLLRSEAKAIQDGRLVVDMTLMDEDLKLLAYGKAVDMLVPAQRWVKNDSKEGSVRLMKI